MSAVRVTFDVLEPDDPIRHKLDGPAAIPVIDLSATPFASTSFSIQLNPVTLTRSEQARWLRRLAEAASSLAVMVERHAAKAVAS